MNIKYFIDDVRWMYEQSLVCEEANMQPNLTGLASTIHVMSRGGAKHGPRVKVSNIAGGFSHDDNFSVTVEHEPRVVGKCKIHSKHLKNVIDWVKINHDHLHKIWDEGSTMNPDDVDSGFTHLY